MRGIGYIVGAVLGLGIAVLNVMGGTQPLRAAVPATLASPAVSQPEAVPADQAIRRHAFAPRTRQGAPDTHAVTPGAPRGAGAFYLSMVAGDPDAGVPAVAAVKDHGKLRLVQAGDTIDGAVVASIDPRSLTLRAGDGTVVLARVRRPG